MAHFGKNERCVLFTDHGQEPKTVLLFLRVETVADPRCEWLVEQLCPRDFFQPERAPEWCRTSGGRIAAYLVAVGDQLPMFISIDGVRFDDARAGLPAERISAELLRLELAGLVAALPGGLYQRLN